MDDIVIIDGARTPVGTFAGALASVPTYELGAVAIRGALERAEVDPADVDDVVMGCVGQTGPEAFNARRAALAAGLPVSSGAMNVNRLCGSGLQAIWTGAMQIMAGDAKVVVAGGNENMSAQPYMDFHARDGNRLGHRTVVDGTLSLVTDPWQQAPMGVTAETVASRYQVTREHQDQFALRSQQRATAARAAGVFADEIVPVTVKGRKGDTIVDRDEHIREDSTIEGLRKLRPAFREGGSVTAGNASGINDGAAAVVLMRESEARDRGLKVGARIAAFAGSGNEPEVMGYAPAIAIPRALEKAGIGLEQVGTVELNEAFAAQALAVARAVGMNDETLNPHGGAIALGHPVGATGAILALRAMRTMQRLDLEYALVTLCIGGGQGVAMVLRHA